ncbi:MAG TPA: ABC transporter permease [Chloroflexota bacterium]
MADPQPGPTAVADAPAAKVTPASRGFIGYVAERWDLVLRLGLLGIIIILAVFFSIKTAPSILQVGSSTFLSVDNLQNIGRQMAVIGVVAIGETFVIVTAGIDLSVGSTLGLTALVSAIMLEHGWPLGLAILVPLVLGAGIGLFNGTLIDTQKLPPFIVTLGMLTVLRGITNIMAGGVDVVFTSTGFTNFGINTTLGIPNLFLVLIAVCLIATVVLHFSRLGRHIYALGSNYEGARLAGINVRSTTLFVYTVSGLLAAIAGILLTSRIGLGAPDSGIGNELDAISASVLGGASLFGARGTIPGTFMGVLLVNMIFNGINLLNVDTFFGQVIEGALLIAIVWVDQWRKRKLAL